MEVYYFKLSVIEENVHLIQNAWKHERVYQDIFDGAFHHKNALKYW